MLKICYVNKKLAAWWPNQPTGPCSGILIPVPPCWALSYPIMGKSSSPRTNPSLNLGLKDADSVSNVFFRTFCFLSVIVHVNRAKILRYQVHSTSWQFIVEAMQWHNYRTSLLSFGVETNFQILKALECPRIK